MLVGVEPIRGDVLTKYFDLNSEIQIINGYGPTETTICSTFYKYKKNEFLNENVPIGKPLPNSKVLILDNNRAPVPVGWPGEIYISGKGPGLY